MDWGTNRHQWNNGVRHNKPSSGGSAEDLAGPVLAGWLSAFSRTASHVSYFITSIPRQFPYHPPPFVNLQVPTVILWRPSLRYISPNAEGREKED